MRIKGFFVNPKVVINILLLTHSILWSIFKFTRRNKTISYNLYTIYKD